MYLHEKGAKDLYIAKIMHKINEILINDDKSQELYPYTEIEL